MRYLSVCSGIEAATCAWHPLGWQPAGFAEVEKFPSAVLAHHYPSVPNFGDMTRFQEWPDDLAPDLIVGGTPCQSFSVAGLRGGLADPRGNLALVYLALADRYRPEWLVWENVPGVLSSNGGRDFGAFLGGLVKLGYGFAYRVLDAQYFGVAQRRRRVFVVANARDWRRAAAVLFERHSLSGHPAPSREAREGTSGRVAASVALRGREGGGAAELGDGCAFTLRASSGGGDKPHALIWPAEVASTLNAAFGSKQGLEDQHALGGGSCLSLPAAAQCLTTGTGQRFDPETETLIPTIGGGFDVAVFDPNQITSKTNRSQPRPELCHTLPATAAAPIAFGWQNSAAQGDDVREECSPTLDKSKTPAVALALRGRDGGATAEVGDDCAFSLRASTGGGDKPHAMAGMAVRRLTPRECERLQGFADGYTAIPWRGKPASECPDGPRYKALGNSMAVPVMAWIGRRIAAVNAQAITPPAREAAAA